MRALARAVPADVLDRARFTRGAAAGLDGLALKARVAHVAEQFALHVTAPYRTAVTRVADALDAWGPSMWEAWPVTEWAGQAGQDDPETALPALARLTRWASAEFAIRPYVDADPEGVRAVLEGWTGHPDEHVRRLVSEGTRPRLPWAPRLAVAEADPGWALPLLDRLATDRSGYVRRSVANHVNDVSRLAPELALRFAAAHGDAPFLRHALRTLVKQGHPEALALVGVDVGAAVTVSDVEVAPERLGMGETLTFGFTITSTAPAPTKVELDYAVHLVRARGNTTPKVFKLASLTLQPGEQRRIRRRHHFKPVTVRRHYPGQHFLDVRCNGQVAGGAAFFLEA